MRISEISRICGYEFCGKDVDVDSIRFAECAKKTDIALLKSVNKIENTEAQCVLISPALINTDKTIIFACDSIEYAAVKIAKVLIEYGHGRNRSCSYQLNKNFYVGNDVILGKNTFVGPNTYIENDVTIGDDCIISSNVFIGAGTVIHNGVKVGSGSSIGTDSFFHYYTEDGLQEFEGIGSVIIEDDVTIGCNTIIQKGTFSDTVIKSRSKIGNLIDIGHDANIGHDCKIVSQTGIASSVIIGDYVTIYGQVGISNGVHIGDRAIVYGKSLVAKNIRENQAVSGMYARNHIDELRLQAKLRKL